jgi:hypothetical protein
MAQAQVVRTSEEQVLSLACTPEIALAICKEITPLRLAKKDMALVFGAANWQKEMVIKHLEAKLLDAKAHLSKMAEIAKPTAENGVGSRELRNLVRASVLSVCGLIRSNITLLETLIHDLK